MSIFKHIKVHYFDKNQPKVRTFDNALEADLFIKFPPQDIRVVSWTPVSTWSRRTFLDYI